jgi:glycogen operon protein
MLSPAKRDRALHEGSVTPLGVMWIAEEEAYNFSLYSMHARLVTLLFYTASDQTTPCFSFTLDPFIHRTTQIWHCRLSRTLLGDARYYGYQIDGPSARQLAGGTPIRRKFCSDPYAHEVFFPPGFDRLAARCPGSNAGKAPLGVLAEEPPFDWGDDVSPRHNGDLVIYEMHVRGFTCSPSSGVAPKKRGTFAGVIEKIPYLKELGVNVVELMPVQQFDPQEGNYWGYMTLNFFAPHHAYAADRSQQRTNSEDGQGAACRGHQVILDVVITQPRRDERTLFCYRGIDNETYYISAARPLSV